MSKYEFVGGLENQQPVAGNQRQTPWQDSAAHRQVVTQMLVEIARTSNRPTLSVWGAGKCDDIELKPLLEHYSEIHLIDLDAGLLAQGAAQQKCTNHERLHQVGGVDLSGVHEQLIDYQKASDSQKQSILAEIIETGKNYTLPECGTFDVVASTCVLSQIVNHIVKCVGESNQEFASVMLPVRNRHLELILNKLNPGGTGLFVTDITSSDTLSELNNPDAKLNELLHQAIAGGNHFHGMNPFAIRHLLTKHAPFANRINDLQISKPWVWNATTRRYACVAFKMVAAQ